MAKERGMHIFDGNEFALALQAGMDVHQDAAMETSGKKVRNVRKGELPRLGVARQSS